MTAPPVPTTPESKAFEAYAKQYGLQPEDLGRTFFLNGVQYQITGLNMNRPKYSICARRVFDGKVYKMTPKQVADNLKHAGPAAPLMDGQHRNVAVASLMGGQEPESVFTGIDPKEIASGNQPPPRPKIQGDW